MRSVASAPQDTSADKKFIVVAKLPEDPDGFATTHRVKCNTFEYALRQYDLYVAAYHGLGGTVNIYQEVKHIRKLV
jgi:hypothetical protein